MGVSFTITAGPRQRIHSRVRVSWDSRPYFTVSNSRPPIFSPPMARRATVDVFEPRVRITLRLMVYCQSVRLGAKPLETRIFFQLNTCGHRPYVTSSLTRGWVCHLPLLLVLASAFILRSESRRTLDHILLSQIWDSPNLESRSPYLYPPGTGWPSYTLRHWVPFPSPSTTRRAMVEVIRTLLHTLEGESAMPWCINSKLTEYKHSIADFCRCCYMCTPLK
jgi:hypothetical protein